MYVKILMIFAIQFLIVGSDFQVIEDFEFVKNTEGCLVLKKKGMEVDKLCVNSFEGDKLNRNQLLEVVDDFVIRVDLKTGAIDSFSDYFYLVEKWKIKNDKLSLESSLKVRLGNINSRKLKLSLDEKGVNWKYCRGIFKRKLKGNIPYSELEKSDEFKLPL